METDDFILNNPTKQGYLFAGWTEGNGTELQPNVTIPRGSTGDKTYTAHWTLSAPTVTLSADPADASGTYSGGSPVVTLTAQASHEVGVIDTYAWYKDGQLLDGKTGSTLEYTIAQGAGTASVTMAGWTYGETATAPIPTSATHGTDHVTYRYTGTTAGGTAYDSSAVPTDAGSYTVTVGLVMDYKQIALPRTLYPQYAGYIHELPMVYVPRFAWTGA